MYDVDLVCIMFLGTFAHDTQAPPQASWCGGISYNSWSDLVFPQGKVNSACYIVQLDNPVLLPFLRQEGDVLFQWDSAHPHMAPVTQHTLRCG